MDFSQKRKMTGNLNLFIGIVVGLLILLPLVKGQNTCFLIDENGAYVTKLNIEHVPDNLAKGDVAAHLKANSTTGESIHLSTTSSQNIHLVNSQLIVVASLYNRNVEVLFVECDVGNKSEILEVLISFDNVNTKPPVFTSSSYSLTVRELEMVGSKLMSLSAQDQDIGNEFITYEVEPGESAEYFEFKNPKDGGLYLAEALDFEKVKTHTITVVAKDNHQAVRNQPTVQLNSSATVIISISDDDDKNPAFSNAPYHATILPDASPEMVIDVEPEISAYDQDETLNSDLHYTIPAQQSQDIVQYFSINSESGQLTLLKSFVTGGIYSLLIQVEQVDNSDRTAVTVVLIEVQVSGSHSPKFTQSVYNVSLLENFPPGLAFFTVTATDLDQDSVLTYNLLPGLQDAPVQVSATTGEVFLTQESDYELHKFFTFQVSVSDGTLDDTCVVQVQLIKVKVNQHNPEFTSKFYSFRGARNIDGGFVGQVMATDEDSDAKITYSLLEQNSPFEIDAQTGRILLTSALTIINTYNLVVLARDSHETDFRQASASVHIEFEGVIEVTNSPSAVTDEQPTSQLITIVILGVLVSILLIALIVGAVCMICKRRRPYSRSYTSYVDNPDRPGSGSDDPDAGSHYKDSLGRHDPSRNLRLYNSIGVNGGYDAGSTTMQENPFRSSRTPSPRENYKQSEMSPGVVKVSRKEFHQHTVPASYEGPFLVDSWDSMYTRPVKGQGHNMQLARKPPSRGHWSADELSPGSAELPIVESLNQNTYQNLKGFGQRPEEVSTSTQGYTDAQPAMGGQAAMRGQPAMRGHGQPAHFASYPQVQDDVEAQPAMLGQAAHFASYPQVRDDNHAVTDHNLNVVPPPLRFSNSPLPEEDQSHSTSSIHSDENFSNVMGSLEEGSTTQLVGDEPEVVSLRRRGSGVISFVEAGAEPSNLYSSLNSQQSELGNVDADRPGITVIY